MKFKTGDKVKIVIPSGQTLSCENIGREMCQGCIVSEDLKNNTYTIRKFKDMRYPHNLWTLFIGDRKSKCRFNGEFFTKVSEYKWEDL